MIFSPANLPILHSPQPNSCRQSLASLPCLKPPVLRIEYGWYNTDCQRPVETRNSTSEVRSPQNPNLTGSPVLLKSIYLTLLDKNQTALPLMSVKLPQ